MATHTIYNTTTIRDYLGFYQPPREYIYFLIVLKGSQPNTSHNKDLIARVYVSPSHASLPDTYVSIHGLILRRLLIASDQAVHSGYLWS
jgi:hypothetical protein